MLVLMFALLADTVPLDTRDVARARALAFIGDERTCAEEDTALDVARFAGASVTRSVSWADGVSLASEPPPIRQGEVAHAPDVVIVVPGRAQLALERGAFMRSAHALLDAVRAQWPRAWIVLAGPETANARTWLNAIAHKRGDGRLSFVLLPQAATRDQCKVRSVALADEVRSRLLSATP